MSQEETQAPAPNPDKRTPLYGELKDYRQPMVTSLGIILGFLLTFLAQWATGTSDAIQGGADVVVLATCGLAIASITYTLYRILNGNLAATHHGTYYRTTLRWYLTCIIITFTGLWLAVLL